ncbi:sulfite exporter TauE/SafE family protein [Alteromonas sp. MB-3u-76]|uniref:sulfite exporter TauE/SafE family protein n=1 Tax=unclassified Alteromonas TaxID=2614992 RepID=UPI000903C2BF|nr:MULTISPECIES: sulfite exporter TauE/SafE family protein [unclassified Alteromonas]APE05579.1 permease [Alteromonas sp. RW2A1]AUC88927.1 sulfite exporter TauE/SafE family protein [Alteromonas sp. MB-3u-76]
MPRSFHLSRFTHQHSVVILVFFAWIALVFSQDNALTLWLNYGFFSAVGVVGAIFANATGAGGGVVFVPFFAYLSFSPESIVATSFAIQCCGMTAGAITWTRFFRKEHRNDRQWAALPSALVLSVPPAICGVVFSQYSEHGPKLLSYILGGPDNLHYVFGIFSIILAIAIIASIPLMKRAVFSEDIEGRDIVLLPVIGFLGGCVTVWLSIGVGELVAVYLIMRGFNVTLSIAVAVILSALTVWSAVPFHVFISHAIVWPVVLFAGMGAIIGGVVAKYLVLAFSNQALKLFFGVWVLLLGVTSLPIF